MSAVRNGTSHQFHFISYVDFFLFLRADGICEFMVTSPDAGMSQVPIEEYDIFPLLVLIELL